MFLMFSVLHLFPNTNQNVVVHCLPSLEPEKLLENEDLYNIDMEICRKGDQPKLPPESPGIKSQISQLSKLYANLS